MNKLFICLSLLFGTMSSAISQSLTEITNLRFYEHHSPTIVAQPGGGNGFNGVQSGYDFVNHTYYPSVTAMGPYNNGEEANIDMVEFDGPSTGGGDFGFSSGSSSIWNGQIKGNSITMWIKASTGFDYTNATNVTELQQEYNNGTPTMDMGAVANNDVYIGKIRNSNLYVAIKCYNVTNNPWTGGMQADVFFDFDYKYGTLSSGNVAVNSISVQGQGGATTVESGGTLQMEATVLPNNASNTSVTWSVTNGTGTATINTTGVLSGVDLGNVVVTATANDGSGVTGSATIDVEGVTSITIQGQGGATVVNVGANLQIEATVLPTNANQSVTWNINNIDGSASINSLTGVLTGVSAGNVVVTALANDGSGTTSNNLVIEVVNPNGIEQLDADYVQVYPNPASEVLNVATMCNSNISIYNLIGELVWNANQVAQSQIDVSNWKKGIYLIKIAREDEITTKKFAVE